MPDEFDGVMERFVLSTVEAVDRKLWLIEELTLTFIVIIARWSREYNRVSFRMVRTRCCRWLDPAWCRNRTSPLYMTCSSFNQLTCSCHQALLQELSYASYLGIQNIILPPPRSRSQVGSYARAINACLARIPYLQLSVRIPIYDPSVIQLAQAPLAGKVVYGGSNPQNGGNEDEGGGVCA